MVVTVDAAILFQSHWRCFLNARASGEIDSSSMTAPRLPCPGSPVRLPRRRRGGVVLAIILVAGCAPAQAQQVTDPAPGAAEGGTFDGILRALDLKPKLSPVPDFVVKSRPTGGQTDYIPVGRTHPERPLKVMTPAEVQAATAALDGARVAQQKRAGVKPPPVPMKGPQAAATPSKTNVQ